MIAGPNFVISNLSNFIDIVLNKYTKHLQSFIKDDIDFLGELDYNITETEIMVSFDVRNINTNIDNEFGQEAIKFWVEKNPENFLLNICIRSNSEVLTS